MEIKKAPLRTGPLSQKQTTFKKGNKNNLRYSLKYFLSIIFLEQVQDELYHQAFDL